MNNNEPRKAGAYNGEKIRKMIVDEDIMGWNIKMVDDAYLQTGKLYLQLAKLRARIFLYCLLSMLATLVLVCVAFEMVGV
jgi:hypothetical protein